MLFETSLFLIGGTRCYLAKTRELVRLLPDEDRAVAALIDKNMLDAMRQVGRAQRAVCEFSRAVGYRHIRRDAKQASCAR